MSSERSPTSVGGIADGGFDDEHDTAAGAAASKATASPQADTARERQRRPTTRGASLARSLRQSERNPEMVIDNPKVIDEIVLTCSSMGYTFQQKGGAKFVPVADALYWLQDLQRVLRRDHDTYRPISLAAGKFNVMPGFLMPLAMAKAHDVGMLQGVVKTMVVLTKPMNDEARNAGRLVVDVKSGKVEDSVILEQIKLRDNAIAQSDMLMEYKKVFVRHESHHYAFHNPHPVDKKKRQRKGLLSLFINMLAEPMAKQGSSRTGSDHMLIELVLHLIRNLLSITPIATSGSVEKAQQAAQLQRDLVIVLQEENALDAICQLSAEVERRENMGYNLLLMEILGHLLRGHDPSEVALSTSKSSEPTLSAPVTLTNKKSSKKAPVKTIVRTTTTTRAKDVGPNSLKALLQTGRQKTQMLQASRHSHFGGTLLVSKHGKNAYVSASNYLAQSAKAGGGAAAKGGGMRGATAVGQPARRKNKKAEVFVGSGKSSAANSRPGASAALSRDVAGPNSQKAKLALDAFCTRFFVECYGPMMKSLKNEFRRDSSRLEDGDRTMFFRIVWFFHQWYRVGKGVRAEGSSAAPKAKGADDLDGENDSPSVRYLMFTMDVFMFNLVLNSTDEFHEHKKPAALADTVALHTEMIHTIHALYESWDPTDQLMALGLMDRLYYAIEPLDRLPRLLSRWTPGTYSREYLCDLVELTHITWKLLDANAVRSREAVGENESERRRPKDTLERMNLTAVEFDLDHYFMRKFVSNHIFFMYTQLLSQYAVNAAHVNRHIVAFFIRLCKFSVKDSADDTEDLEFDDALGKNDLAKKPATMEPMLYNIGLFNVLEKVLNDRTIRENEDFHSLLMFASSFMKRFARAAEVNPMLFVEAMFKHPVPHRFCESATNMYVNEELRMIAVRDLLLEDQRRYEEQAIEAEKNDAGDEGTPGYVDDDEEELEFNLDDEDEDVGIVTNQKKKKRKRNNRKSHKLKWAEALAEGGQSDDEEEFKTEGDKAEAGEKDEFPSPDQEGEQQKEDAELPSLQASVMDEDVGEGPKLSGKKRIRKALEADDEESDEEDFTSAAPATKRVIFDDDDDDD